MTDLIRKSDALALVDHAIHNEGGMTTIDAYDAIAALPAVTVGVKPLVWEQTADNAWVTQAYSIHQYWPHNNGHFRVHGYTSNVGAFGLKIYDTLQEAKEAAQAHHTARIRAALTTNPVDDSQTPDPAINPAAIREAALREAAAEVQRNVMLHREADEALALNLAIYGRDAVLALITKGAADDRA